MDVWTKVKWTEARQIAELMGVDEDARPDEGLSPRDYFERARSEGRLEEAVKILGHALPRYEGVAWAAHLLDERARQERLRPRDRQALDYAMRWVGEPNDDHRRAAFEASEAASEDSAERLLALAVFLSGGSMAPANLQPVLPRPELSGRMASIALVIAGHRGKDSTAFFEHALELGDKVANDGVEALPSA